MHPLGLLGKRRDNVVAIVLYLGAKPPHLAVETCHLVLVLACVVEDVAVSTQEEVIKLIQCGHPPAAATAWTYSTYFGILAEAMSEMSLNRECVVSVSSTSP
jgi:hypothetical protein